MPIGIVEEMAGLGVFGVCVAPGHGGLGMAKLLAARVAWSNADTALQIHGGNGYALEYPISRLLGDARILNIFEGAAEIQAHVIARGLVATSRNA